MSRRWFTGLSIQWKLPLIMGGVLVALTIALSWAAYVEARRAAIAGAGDRLVNVALQFDRTLEEGVAAVVRQAAVMAGDSIVIRSVAAPGQADTVLTNDALQYRGTNPQQVAAVELLDRSGRPLFGVGAGLHRVRALPGHASLPLAAVRDSLAISRFVRLGDTLVYAVIAPVATPPRGWLVSWRYMLSSPGGRTQIADLIGSNATLYIGNRSGDPWTDLHTVVDPPPVDVSNLAGPVRYRRDQSEQLAMAHAIEGTPWFTVLEFSQGAVLSPLGPFVRRLAAIASVMVLAGLIVAWSLSRRITRPLLRLTEAAEAMSAADYSARVDVARKDEIGRLAREFNRAAEQVRESQSRLEEKVADRTRELREAQESLVRREKLAILGLLAGGVGHELRNPLGVMTNAVYYIEAVLPDPPAKVRQHLGILRDQIALAEKIVYDLLEFARVKPPRRQHVEVAAMVEQQIARLTIPQHVELHQAFPPDLPRAYVDPAQIGQVIQNLLVNALQAIGASPGVVTMEACAGDRGEVRLNISDTGPGIPQDQLDRIFEPLYTTKARGIGLGLAVSRTLAVTNGATLQASSNAGAGATFSLTLPAQHEAQAA